ncbi:hypothetical protein AVEN_195201-1, partial [Araneus ventricosus]
ARMALESTNSFEWSCKDNILGFHGPSEQQTHCQSMSRGPPLSKKKLDITFLAFAAEWSSGHWDPVCHHSTLNRQTH